MMPFEVIVMFF